jgi:hypothetical protein
MKITAPNSEILPDEKGHPAQGIRRTGHTIIF